MKLGYGVSALSRGLKVNRLDGIGNYTQQLLERLNLYEELEITPITFGYDASKPQLPRLKDMGRFSRQIAMSLASQLPFFGTAELSGKIDFFHSTDHYIPNFGGLPVLATIHDAIPVAHPEWVSTRHRLIITPTFKRSVRWAEHIITVSEYSKEQIIEHLKIPSERITVIANGVDKTWMEPIDARENTLLMSKFGISRPYIIFVGTLQPRKNIQRLIKAYRCLPIALRHSYDLLIVGQYGWGCDELITVLKEEALKGGVHWLNFLPDQDLQNLVKGASCLALPSLSEGFGLPILEAFAAGVPVLTSSLTALPEVADKAAVLVDPYDIGAIAHGLEKILGDTIFANDLREKGIERACLFTWDRTAEQTIQLYKRFM